MRNSEMKKGLFRRNGPADNYRPRARFGHLLQVFFYYFFSAHQLFSRKYRIRMGFIADLYFWYTFIVRYNYSIRVRIILMDRYVEINTYLNCFLYMDSNNLRCNLKEK